MKTIALSRIVVAAAVAGAMSAVGLMAATPASAISVSLDYVTPTSGSTYGGDLVHVHGTNISLFPHVLFGGNLATLVSTEGVNDITVVAPPGEPGPVDVALVIVTSGSIYPIQGRIPAPLTIVDGYTYVDPSPAPWFQSIGRAKATDPCPPGWTPSWAEWMNLHTGGFVCNREQYWNLSIAEWAYRIGR